MSSFIYDSLRINNRFDVTGVGKIVTANKGDLITDNGTKTIVLPVGVNGQIPFANSATATGLEYRTPVANDVSDFDTEVANNTDVSTNTTHRGLTNNPHSVTKTQVGLGNVADLKVNLIATSDPTITNDSASGYSIGSRWFNGASKKEYVCTDASVGAAFWIQTTEVAADGVLANISGATYKTVQEVHNTVNSSGWVSGGVISDGGAETVDITSGTGFIRATDSSVSQLLSLNWATSTGVSIATDSIRYIGVQYNSGSPNIVTKTTNTWNYNTEFPLGSVVNEGGTVYIINNPHIVNNHLSYSIQRLECTSTFEKDCTVGGLQLSNTGTRNLIVSSGKIWSKLRSFTIPAVNTSVSDTLDTFYSNGSSGWTKVTGQTQWSNINYDDGTGTLGVLTDAKYSILWVYLELSGKIIVVYGSTQYDDSATAENEYPPTSVPKRVSAHSVCLGRLIFQKNASTPTLLQTVYGGNAIQATSSSDHNNLSSLQGGTTNEYYHLTATVNGYVSGLTSTAVGVSDTQTLTGKTIDSGSNTITNIVDADIKADANIDASKIANGSVSNAEFQKLSSVSSNVVGETDIQTLTNKSLVDSTTFFVDNNDNTRKVQLNLDNVTSGVTRTLNIPDANTTIVGTDVAQTLTNKTFGDNLNMNSYKITSLAVPTQDSDAATKSYVDAISNGLDIKASVKVASVVDLDSNSSVSGTVTYSSTGGVSTRGQITGTLAVSDVFTVDGVSLSASDNGSRILLKNQVSGDQNGVWTVVISGTSLTLDRSTDFDSDAKVNSGSFTFVEEGTVNDNNGFVLTTNNPIIIGGVSGTSLSFSQFSGAGQITAGTGLTKSGNTVNAVGSSTIIANADSLEVNSSNTSNQVLLSSGTPGTASSFGSLPLGNSSSVSGVLGFANGGSNTSSFAAGSRLVSTNSGNTALETTSLDPSIIATTTGAQTVTNKSFVDNSTLFENNGDSAKKFKFDASAITTSNTRIISVPDSDLTLVGVALTQTFTNKSIDAGTNTLSNIANANIKTDAAIDAFKIGTGLVDNDEFSKLNGVQSSVVGVSDTQIVTNKTMLDTSTTFANTTDATKKLKLDLSGLTTSTTRIVTVPDSSFTIAGLALNQTFTNKVFDADLNYLSNVDNNDIKAGANIDATKIANGDVNNTSFQHLAALSSAAVGVSDLQTLINKTLTSPTFSTIINIGTLTLPTSTDTLIGRNTTDTLTNKSIDSTTNTITNIANASVATNANIDVTKLGTGAVDNTKFNRLSAITSTVVGVSDTQTLINKTLTTPRINTAVNDSNGNELIKLTSVSSAVNEITVANSVTSSGPTVSATGNDTNIDLNIESKGSGKIVLDGLKWPSTDGATNQVLSTNGAGSIGFSNVPVLNISTATTTDATVTTVSTTATVSNAVYLVESHVVSRRTDSGTEAAGFVIKGFFRNNGGTLTKIGEDRVYAKDVTEWDLNISVSGTDIVLLATGKVGSTIDWKASTKVTSLA